MIICTHDNPHLTSNIFPSPNLLIIHSLNVNFHHYLPLTSCCINHAGSGTISTCLKSKIRQICFPVCYDQIENARKIEEFGGGREGDLDCFESVREKVEWCFEGGVEGEFWGGKENCERIIEELYNE